MAKNLLIKNCRILNPSSKEIKESDIFVENGIIAKIEKVKKVYSFEEILDAEGRIVTPGFIDLHIQGAGGADILDGKRESLEIISRTCAKFGTTSFLATTLFRPEGNNHHLEVASESVGSDLGGANLLGIHLEGPFISAASIN